MLSTSKAICQFYKSSRGCKFGTNCRFVHSLPPDISAESKSQNGILNAETTNPALLTFSITSSEVKDSKKQNEELKELTGKQEKDLTHKQLKVCHYFYKYGNCRFGTKCKFVHTEEGQQVEPIDEDGKLVLGAAASGVKHNRSPTNKLNIKKDEKIKPRRKPVCHFFKFGTCKKGEDCKFRHVVKSNISDLDHQDTAKNEKEVLSEIGDAAVHETNETKKIRPLPKHKFSSGNFVRELQRELATEQEVENLRAVELQQLKKRFPKDKLTVLPENGEGDVFLLSFSSSDPDWPYDVKVFELKISFPKKYPMQMMKVSLPEEQNLPETVRRYVEVSIHEWVEEKEKQNVRHDIVVMVFRPFLKWLDKNLEEMVTEGLKQLQRELMAKAAGLEFIPASQLRKEALNSAQSGSSEESESDVDENGREFTIYKKQEVDEVYTGPTDNRTEGSSNEYETSEDETTKKEIDCSETAVKGTEIRLRNLQLRESASTMVFNQIKLMIQCRRCHNRLDVKTPPNQVSAIACQKCNQSQLVNYRATMVHQFSSIIGYLDLEGCTAFDLLLQDCNFMLGCLGCSKETPVIGLPPGVLMDISCHTCHQKMKIAADSAKFTELQTSSVDQDKAVNIPVMKIKKIPKDPRITLGFPLPDNGTCKHFRKSFRWFRFPCCGKCYPCDLCHEDKEDHEMATANRMICGHCCKEQPFALEKPCVACHHLMTKSRSTFWEGGKGCRDKTKMSRDDVKKYSNMNKTVSRRAQEKVKPTKKKENK